MPISHAAGAGDGPSGAHRGGPGPGADPVETRAPSGLHPLLMQPALAQIGIDGTAAHDAAAGSPRFTTGDLLGVGTTGEVFTVTDRNLERAVAVKIIPPQLRGDREAISHLIDEARITASLAHPNVLPVYDLDLDRNGRAYFSMKRIEGRSLGDAIGQSSQTARDPWIATPNAVVTIFIGVAQALAYAHRRGIVHQDIKPENIMLGEYGEVLVVDWGSAERLSPEVRPRLYGTPLYMSPEQARSESVDRRSDVYCLGATLLHVLLLRLPMWSEDVDIFWRRKRLGTFDAITPQERRLAPAALLSITLKALSPMPDDRYADAGAMLTDLQAYQAGLAVSAHHDSLRERWLRFHRRYGRQLWLAVAAVALLAILLGVIVHERLTEQASWGQPVVADDFADAGSMAHWLPLSGRFARSPGEIVSQVDQDSQLFYDRKFVGATAIEYDAEILPGSPPCDLSAVWASTLTFDAAHTKVLSTGPIYYFQFGANDDSFTLLSSLLSGSSGKRPLSYSPLRVAVGRTYHVRAEVADNRLQLSVDGQVVCTWTQPFAFSSGYFGLYAFYKGKAFRHVRIYSRGVPQKVSATAIGDSYVQNGLLEEAATQYEWVSRSQPDTAVGREAIYKDGICRYQQKAYDEAFRIWQPLRHDPTYGPLITLEDIDALTRSGTTADVIQAMQSCAETASADILRRLALAWGDYANTRINAGDINDQKALLAFHDRYLSDQLEMDTIAAQLLFDQGRYQDVLTRFPQQRSMCASSLQAMQLYWRLHDEYPEQVWPVAIASFYLGYSNDFSLSQQRFFGCVALGEEGRFDEGRARAFGMPNQAANMYAMQGRFTEALALVPKMDADRARILCLAGRSAEVRPFPDVRIFADLADGHPEPWASQFRDRYNVMARDLVAFRRWRDGDHHLPLPAFEPITDQDYTASLRNTFVAFAVPLMQQLAGDAGALQRSCTVVAAERRWWDRQRLYYQAQYLLGNIDDATYLQHPWRYYAPAELLLMKAIHAEDHGEPATAVANYRAWLALPEWQRDDFPSATWNEFAAWRIASLSAPPQVQVQVQVQVQEMQKVEKVPKLEKVKAP